MQTGKILVLSNDSAWTYGLRKELIQKLLSENTVYISVADLGYKSALEKLGAKVVKTRFNRRGKNPFSDFKLMLSYCSLLKKIKPDIVLTYTIKPNVYGGIACRMTKTPYVANITGLGTAVENPGILQKITLLLYKFGLKSASCVFFQNTDNRDFMLENHIVKGKYAVLPGSGVNLTKYHILDYPDGDVIHFSFIARVMKEKGIDQFLRAAEFIVKKYSNTQFHVYGACEQNYADILNGLQKKKIIVYHGFVKDTIPVYQMSSCIVLPTYYPEGINNVLLESCACGRPIITTERSGCREIIDDGVNGYAVPQQNTDALIEAIEKFIALPRERKIEMGKAGRKKVEKEFDRNIVVSKYMEEVAKIGRI